MALFKQEQLEDGVIRGIALQISLEYTQHYLQFAAGDIITGLSGLSYFDSIAREFPLHDSQLLGELYEALGVFGRRYRFRDVVEAAGVRGSADHLPFVTTVRTALRACRANVASEIPQFGQREELRALLGAISGRHRKGTGSDLRIRMENATLALSSGMRRFANRDRNFARLLEQEQSNGSSFDVLIVTATELESLECLAAAQQSIGAKPRRFRQGENVNVYLDLGVLGGARIAMVESEAGSGGPSGSTLTIMDAIRDLKPRAIILAGIAFGTRPDRHYPGDVLISTKLVDYELQKIATSSEGDIRIIPRGNRAHADTMLLNAFRSARLDWNGKTRFGTLLSGEKLVANARFRDGLLAMESEAIGGEMEGAGLYAAADRARSRWIVVKGICDWADHLKDDTYHQLAAERAMSFVFHAIRQGNVS